MTVTALETYVEERIAEAMDGLLAGHTNSRVGEFMRQSLQADLRGFHNPDAGKVCALYRKYLQIELAQGWVWNNYDADRAKTHLNALIAKRGDVVHRSPPLPSAVPSAHAVTRDDLRKHIRFVRDLVSATDQHLHALGL